MQDIEAKMPEISFEDTIDDISLDNLESLLYLSAGRVSINLHNVNLSKILSNSKFKNLLTEKDPMKLSKDDKEFFYRLLKKKVY